METEFNMAYRISNPYQVSNTALLSYFEVNIGYRICNIRVRHAITNSVFDIAYRYVICDIEFRFHYQTQTIYSYYVVRKIEITIVRVR